MTDPRLENLAKILVNYSTAVKNGDWVLVQGNVLALPLVNEVEKIDCAIILRASANTRALSGVAPEKQRLRQGARMEIFKTQLERAAQGSLRWILTNYPCEAFAHDADMSLRDYENFVYAATFAACSDPIQAWQDIDRQQQRLVEWFKGKKQVVLRGPHCDLSLSITDRTFINCSGKNNMPDGEIFTGPIEDSANGWVHFTYPAVHGGREVEGVELIFEQGKVIDAHAKKNEEYLLALLDMDPGARYLGEFAIGTNYNIQRFTRDILFDEKIGGSFHMAIGSGYPETGSKNQSGLHWDFICDMRTDSEIWVDDELIYKNGAFLI
jgi:aminopeptidase